MSNQVRIPKRRRNKMERLAADGKRGLLGIHITWLCKILTRYNPERCHYCTECEMVRLGYPHKGQACVCRKVQYEDQP